MELRKIASFQVDHRKVDAGMYVSRTDGALHTIEHLFATYARSSGLSAQVVYVGPMGCRTDFYLLVRDLMPTAAIGLVRDSFEFIASFEGPIPGASEGECGNWRDHDLAVAKAEASAFLRTLGSWTEARLAYPG